MKKITLSIALLTGIITAKAQDTTCTYFEGDRVIEFNFKTSKVLSETKVKITYITRHKVLLKYQLVDQN